LSYLSYSLLLLFVRKKYHSGVQYCLTHLACPLCTSNIKALRQMDYSTLCSIKSHSTFDCISVKSWQISIIFTVP